MPNLVTSLDPKFEAHIEALQVVSASVSDAARLLGQRKWHYPPLESWDGDPQNLVSMISAFDRTALNQLYVDIINEGGKTGESMVIKLQVDYIAAMERAFRTRHASSVRLRLHASARRKQQGTSGGIFTSSIVLWLTRLLSAAHREPLGSV